MNCSLSSFPLKYLGISISPDPITSKELRPLVLKVGIRVLPWRGRHHSSAAKVCLINACLSSLPTYTMGFYLLPGVSHEAMDKHRRKFYWNSADNKRKYQMLKWKTMCQPKKVGGLGIMDTTTMKS